MMHEEEGTAKARLAKWLAKHWKRRVARLTGLEPATPGVTGRYSNRLSYNRAMGTR